MQMIEDLFAILNHLNTGGKVVRLDTHDLRTHGADDHLHSALLQLGDHLLDGWQSLVATAETILGWEGGPYSPVSS